MDINPCSAHASFNFEIVLTLNKLRMFNDEAVRELDKDVARQFFRVQGLPIPGDQAVDETKPVPILQNKSQDKSTDKSQDKSEDKENVG